MEPEKNTAPEGMEEQEQKEVKKPPLPVKAVFWITLVLLVALVGLIAAMLISYSQKLAGVFVLLIFVFAIVNKACWKCPACGKHLGRFGYPRNCPHCGEDLKM